MDEIFIEKYCGFDASNLYNKNLSQKQNPKDSTQQLSELNIYNKQIVYFNVLLCDMQIVKSR